MRSIQTIPTGRAVLIGATGNAGTAFANQFLKKGWQLQGTSRSTKRLDAFAQRGLVPHQLDITDKESIKAFVSAMSAADVLILNAGILEGRNKEDFFDTNAEGSRALLAELRKQGKMPKALIHMSSMLVSGPTTPSATQHRYDHRYDIGGPDVYRSDYGKSKVAGETAAFEEFQNANDTTKGFVSIRPAAILGPDDQVTTVPMIAALRGILGFIGGYLNLTTGPDPKLSVVGASDLATVIEHIASQQLNEPKFGVYDVENGKGGYTLDDIGQAGKDAFGTKHIIVPKFPTHNVVWGVLAIIQEGLRLLGKATPLDFSRPRELSNPDNFATNDRLYQDYPALRNHQFQGLGELLKEAADAQTNVANAKKAAAKAKRDETIDKFLAGVAKLLSW